METLVTQLEPQFSATPKPLRGVLQQASWIYTTTHTELLINMLEPTHTTAGYAVGPPVGAELASSASKG